MRKHCCGTDWAGYPGGNTPYIKDGTWWVAGKDTGVKAVPIDGKNGIDGINGIDGVSPIVAVENTEEGAKLYITDIEGTKEVELRNGIDGVNGIDGINGIDGRNVTVTVVEDTDTSYRLSIDDQLNVIETPNLKGEDGKAVLEEDLATVSGTSVTYADAEDSIVKIMFDSESNTQDFYIITGNGKDNLATVLDEVYPSQGIKTFYEGSVVELDGEISNNFSIILRGDDLLTKTYKFKMIPISGEISDELTLYLYTLSPESMFEESAVISTSNPEAAFTQAFNSDLNKVILSVPSGTTAEKYAFIISISEVNMEHYADGKYIDHASTEEWDGLLKSYKGTTTVTTTSYPPISLVGVFKSKFWYLIKDHITSVEWDEVPSIEVDLPKDADTLGGYSSEHYATKEELNDINDRLTWKFYGNVAGNVDTQYSAINNNVWNELFIQVQYSGVCVGFYFPRTTIVGQGSKHWHGGSYFSTTVNVGVHVWTGSSVFNLATFQLNGTAVTDKSKVTLTIYYK